MEREQIITEIADNNVSDREEDAEVPIYSGHQNPRVVDRRLRQRNLRHHLGMGEESSFEEEKRAAPRRNRRHESNMITLNNYDDVQTPRVGADEESHPIFERRLVSL